jgi:hypothetical protein
VTEANLTLEGWIDAPVPSERLAVLGDVVGDVGCRPRSVGLLGGGAIVVRLDDCAVGIPLTEIVRVAELVAAAASASTEPAPAPAPEPEPTAPTPSA